MTTVPTSTSRLPVAVIGAGPIGLAAATHLLERGLVPVILEAGDQPGASVAEWRHVRLFTPWCLALDQAALRLLTNTGWPPLDPDWLPTGHDLLERYLLPLAATPELAPHLRLGHAVTGIARLGLDKVRSPGREHLPFVVRVRSRDGGEHDLEASAVIDAAGTWTQPNPLGANGLPALGERTAIAGGNVVTGLPDILGRDHARFAGRRVLVVGAGHSAATSLLALAQLQRRAPGTQIVWAVRSATPRPLVGKGNAQADELPARGQLATDLRALIDGGQVELVTSFRTRAVRPDGEGVTVVGDDLRELHANRVVNATGFRPDHAIARELRLALDPALESAAALAPLIDPNVHTCGTVPAHGAAQLAHPDRGYYVVGMKSYGRAPTFLLATGYEQVRSVTAALAGDQQGAGTIPSGPPTARFCRVTNQLLHDARRRRPATISSAAADPVTHRTAHTPGDWSDVTCCDQPAQVAAILHRRISGGGGWRLDGGPVKPGQRRAGCLLCGGHVAAGCGGGVGSLLALVPLLVAATAILTTFLLILGLTELTDVSVFVEYLVALIGLGVAIDYSLLLVTRWREELAAGHSGDRAVALAMATAGRAVVFSGVTVAIGLLSMVMLPVPFLRSMGYAGMLIPLVSVLVTLTLLPVLLATIGQRADWPHRRKPPHVGRGWAAWARGVRRQRWLAVLAALAVLVPLGVAGLGLRLGTPNADALAPADPAWRRGGTAIVDVQPLAQTGTQAGKQTVTHIRQAAAAMPTPASASRQNPGPRVQVGGAGPQDVDFTHAVYGRFPLMLAVIAAVTFVLLARAFRSPLLPLKAVLLNLLSVGAIYGVLVLVWQHGHGSRQLWGVPATGSVGVFIPLIVFAFLYGLSMDYEVFIVARMREAYDRTGSTTTAITEGIGRTGRLVTSAALTLLLAFASLASGPIVTVKVFATGLGAGIFLDATAVRALLVPALVSLFGRWNWWLPSWAAWPLGVQPSPSRADDDHQPVVPPPGDWLSGGTGRRPARRPPQG